MNTKNIPIVLFIFVIIGYRLSEAQIATVCNNVPSGITAFVRNSESCNSYYWCDNGVGKAAICPDNLAFEVIHETCAYADLVDCTACSKYGSQNIADPADPTKYFECINGIRTPKQCTPNTFNKQTGLCEGGGSGGGGSGGGTPIDVCTPYVSSPTMVELPDPNDCTKYFICTVGQTVSVNCATGLHFNPNTKKCDFASNVPCTGDSPSPSNPTSPTIPTTTTTTVAGSVVTDPPTASTPSAGGPPPLDCLTGADYIPFPGDCTQYYQCLMNVSIPKTCPSGMFWNQNVRSCLTTAPAGGC